MSAEPHARGKPAGPLSAEISKEIVRLLHEYTGRGPVKARTYVHPELVTCLLRDTFTAAERRLVEKGQADAVLGLRAASQRALRGDAIASVERLTGQEVIGFMSTNHVDPDLGVETFVLRPPD